MCWSVLRSVGVAQILGCSTCGDGGSIDGLTHLFFQRLQLSLARYSVHDETGPRPCDWVGFLAWACLETTGARVRCDVTLKTHGAHRDK